MARRGVWQLQRLVLSYCETSGSSRGARCVEKLSGRFDARDFVGEFLPSLAADNQQIQIAQELRPGRHPLLLAEYKGGTTRHVDIKNKPKEEILRQAMYLRNSLGRKASLQIKHRHVPKVQSIQGQATQGIAPG